MRTRYLDLDDRTQDLAERMREEPAAAEDFLRKYELSWLYHENALEGVIYAAHELEAALENQPLAEASQIGPFQEVRNHKAAIELIRAEAKVKRPRGPPEWRGSSDAPSGWLAGPEASAR